MTIFNNRLSWNSYSSVVTLATDGDNNAPRGKADGHLHEICLHKYADRPP